MGGELNYSQKMFHMKPAIVPCTPTSILSHVFPFQLDIFLEVVTGSKPFVSFMPYPNRKLSRTSLHTTSWSDALGTVSGSLPLTCWCVRCDDMWVLTWSATILWLGGFKRMSFLSSLLEMSMFHTIFRLVHRWLTRNKLPLLFPTSQWFFPWARLAHSHHWGSEFLRQKRPLARDHWASRGNACSGCGRCDQFQCIHQLLGSQLIQFIQCQTANKEY